MELKVKTSTIYFCHLEAAFKTGMLCDLSKVHTGYGFMPKVTHTSEDADWGKVGSSKKVHVKKSFMQPGGFALMDHVLERIENKYWKIQVDQFQSWMMGFEKFVGEWETTEIDTNKIRIDYSYTLHAHVPIFYPLNWLVGKLFWKRYMDRVLENVRVMIDNKEPYLYD